MKDISYIVVPENREYESSILFSKYLHITKKHHVPVLSPRFWWLVVGFRGDGADGVEERGYMSLGSKEASFYTRCCGWGSSLLNFLQDSPALRRAQMQRAPTRLIVL